MGTPFRALPIPSPRLPGSVRRSVWVANTPSQTASKACRWKLAAVKSSQTLETADTDLIQLISDISKDVDSRHAGLLRDAKGATPDIEGLDSSLRGKAQTAILSLQSGLLERETEVRLLLLAALCGEHLLLLGPPGTAKSELSRRLAELTGGRYFERLLTRFSVPEELFGPLSMKGLENDLYERQTSGYLPTAEVAFIDEVFKANSAILNALLTILNERLFSNGSARLEVPLLCLVGASNELPESEELDALYDRFLLRRQVAQVSSAQLGNLARLAAGSLRATTQTSADGAEAGGGRLELADFHGTASTAYSAVEVPDSVIDLLTTTRDYLQDKCEPPIYVSDRRFMKAIKMLQVAAHVDGRSAVHEYDCLLLEFVLGSRPDDSQKVRAFVLETIASDPGLQQLELVFLGLFGRACRALEGGNEQDVAEAQQEASQLVELLDLRQGSVGLTLDGGFADLGATIWQSEGSVREAVQVLTPPMTENRKKAEDLLREALLLQTALQRQVAASALERILPKRYKQYQKDPNFLQQLMQDPTIQRMTEAIASDPEFMEIAKEMQESMLSGNMNGLNLGGEAGGSGAGGMPPGMPNVDPAKYMSAMQRVMGNPQFLEAAESLGKSLLTQAADPQMASLMELFSNPEHSELLKGKLEDLKSDPELRPILEDIEANGQEAMLKYMGDTDIMSKLGRKFQEAMADPEMQARLGSRAATDANGTPAVSGGAGAGEAGEEEEEEEEATVISLASAGDAAGLAELLKQEGVKPDEKDEEGRTPLHFAAGYGELECMEVLLDAGADIDAVDANNNTALHYAAGYGNVETATLLIKRKADVSIKNSEGKTAGEVAELNEQAELVELLKGDVKPEAV